jgi:hypothetical protein
MTAAEQGLRQSLIIWAEVAGPKFEAVIAQEKAFEEAHGASVEMLMRYLFSPPGSPEEEEAAIRRAQGTTDTADDDDAGR